MNNGAFGENFPYSNFHDLNMDWIIKIAKDFLDQYTHIQETIENGLLNISDAEQTALDDIATELSNTLQTIEETASTTLSTTIHQFELMADTKARETLESIPADYTQLYNDLVDLTIDFGGLLESLGAHKVKNFFNPSVLTTLEYNSNQCYTIGVNGVTVEQNDYNAVTEDSSLLTLPTGTYTISTTNPCRIQIYKNGTLATQVNPGTSLTFSVTAEDDIYIKFLTTETPYLIGNIQIEYGNTASPYTPYDTSYFYNSTALRATGVFNLNRISYLRLNAMSEKTDNEGTLTEGVVRYTDNTIVNVGYHSTLSVNAGDLIYFNGYCYGTAFPILIALFNNQVVGSFYHNVGDMYGNVIVPYEVDTIIVNGTNTDTAVAKIPNSSNKLISIPMYIDKKTNNLKGKKIVWYGTSIPAGGYIGSEVTRNYPTFIAEKYDCTVFNEAVGSSCAHCKELNAVSTANPYGFNPDYTLSSRCLTNTEEEMQWMIAHYNESFWTNKPTLTDEYKSQMLSFSFANRVDKYLTNETFPDLFVFDHGYNDYVSSADNYTGHEFEAYTLRGALNILFRRIYSFNPKAKILIIGNYKYQTRNGLVVNAQKETAQFWDIPMFDTWKYTSLSDAEVYTTKQWVQSGGSWVEQDTTYHSETLNNILLPDGVHPHSRPDNLIINRMADAIGNWLNLNAIFNKE